jgi:threonine synthase
VPEPTVPTAQTVPSETGVTLGCTQCARVWPVAASLFGCPTCAATLEVRYAARDAVALRDVKRNGSIWDFKAFLPVGARGPIISLGEGWTPLIPARTLGPCTLLKYEAVNPTTSFKDRLNAVSVSMAVQLGYKRVLCTSTGNHGVSLAAYAAAAGLECLVVCSPGIEPLAVRQIRQHGARAIRVVGPAAATRAWLATLIQRDGWWPSVRNHPRPFANPFGLEGYKTIAYEIWAQLDGRVPDWVLVPTGGGDSLAGIARGFHELYELGLAARPPRLVACQPDAAAPLVQAVHRGDTHVAPVDVSPSIAVSIAEDHTGEHALRALDTDDRAVGVSEQAIRAAVEQLAASGLCVDPASAASVAAMSALRGSGAIGANELAVCIATGGGLRWSAAFDRSDDGQPELVHSTPDGVM